MGSACAGREVCTGATALLLESQGWRCSADLGGVPVQAPATQPRYGGVINLRCSRRGPWPWQQLQDCGSSSLRLGCEHES
eukprot:1021282-Rhodomonas_salina.1